MLDMLVYLLGILSGNQADMQGRVQLLASLQDRDGTVHVPGFCELLPSLLARASP
jgi:hypothetical protein